MALISVLLPTRGRPDMLERSVESLRTKADYPSYIDIMCAVDQDDEAQIAKVYNLDCLAHVTPRYGYTRLHDYVNQLDAIADRNSIRLLWNDDALMMTKGWDSVLRVASFIKKGRGVYHLHSNMDPLSIFPAWDAWVTRTIGHVSLSPHNDTWISDVGAEAGLGTWVNIRVLHDRFDATGNNDDAVYREGVASYRTEEYYQDTMTELRRQDAERLKEALRSTS